MEKHGLPRREDGTYFDVGEELIMLRELHEALEQEEQKT